MKSAPENDVVVPTSLTPDVLNELYRCYRRNDDGRATLRDELVRLGLLKHHVLIEQIFVHVLQAPYFFLDNYPGGAVNSPELWEQHDAEIRKQSPWLDDDNFNYARQQSIYFSIHDGLVRSE